MEVESWIPIDGTVANDNRAMSEPKTATDGVVSWSGFSGQLRSLTSEAGHRP